jgi:AbrB family looped-hinge helix DNA binding protein
MQTTIDAGGRLVVPKAIREAMGLEPGRVVDIVFVDGRIEIELAPLRAHVEHGDGLPRIVADEAVPPLTEDDVREAVEETRR